MTIGVNSVWTSTAILELEKKMSCDNFIINLHEEKTNGRNMTLLIWFVYSNPAHIYLKNLKIEGK